MRFFRRIVFSCLFSLFITTCLIIFFRPIFSAKSLFVDYGFISFDVCEKFSFIWTYIYQIYFCSSFVTYFVIGNSIFSRFFKNTHNEVLADIQPAGLNLFIGKTVDNKNVYIDERRSVSKFFNYWYYWKW